MIRSLIYRACLKASKNPTKLIRLLAKIELGIACHCRKMACELDPNLSPPQPNRDRHSDNELAMFLFNQYIEERLHGQMLAASIDEPSWKQGGIGRVRHPTHIASKVEGISTLEPFKLLLSGKRAEDFDLVNRLAMMSVLESYSETIYSCLASIFPDSDSPFQKIAFDERSHKHGLSYYLTNSAGIFKSKFLILKWKTKALFVLPKAIKLAIKHLEND